MIIKSIIIFYIFLFVFTTSTPLYDYYTSLKEENDLTLTKELTEFLETVIQRLEEKFNLGVTKQPKKSNKHIENETKKDPIEKIEESGYFGGDIVLTENQADSVFEQVSRVADKNNISISDLPFVEKRKRRKRKIKDDRLLKWGAQIPYFIDQGVTGFVVDIALKLMQEETCLNFTKITEKPNLKEGLRYYVGKGCHSHLGRIYEFTAQDVSIGPGCATLGTVQHETMHALGCEHEQSRADRDKYLKLFLENVVKGREHNFLKIELTDYFTYETSYDYGSTMQYHTKAFSSNDKFTMLPALPFYGSTLGMDEGMSFLDAKLLNLHYCKNMCPNTIKCKRGGYQNPKNCNVCKCIEGFEGPTCNDLPKRKEECGKIVRYNITDEMTRIKVLGKKDCVYHLRAPKGSRIKIKLAFLTYNPQKKNTCQKVNALEIKYLKDKTQTGAFFCDTQEGLTLETEDHYALVFHRSLQDSNAVEFAATILKPK
ncbi:Astacin-like metalloendopeptidase [Strongyloides ratti]|uniref:Zinc metalloproteinase n=1 Tax=Strongyloides ratti TaxID=34506 RepID=A0A090MQ52_STRRB|nr:Astacin-like metalloendopeptidase [Strongyloides ratti]CEF60273.1 Astacin-like metalloendopeptidase [Strongyloides ratti]